MTDDTTKNDDSFDEKDDSYWQEKLTPEQFAVLRMRGTEPPFSGEYYMHSDDGMYLCAACGQELFSSDTKFDSGSGWPSFGDPAKEEQVALSEDTSHGTKRIEVSCSRCGSHLGHVFDDGPNPTGKRYCINSVCLNFHKK